MLAIELSPDTEETFRLLSEETGRPLNELVQDALDHFLAEWEDQKDVEYAKKTLEEYQRNPGQPFTLDDALNRYGLSREELMS
ncbi:MAG: hypothetical protein HQL64_00910 [Magnetococcales bacterium]|nr:hypothetical protein [Magnetococcales bacterium]